MSSENEEKELSQKAYIGLFGAGFFKQSIKTDCAINNLKLMIRYFIDNREMFGEHFLYIKRRFELCIEVVEKFQASKERSFNALTLT